MLKVSILSILLPMARCCLLLKVKFHVRAYPNHAAIFPPLATCIYFFLFRYCLCIDTLNYETVRGQSAEYAVQILHVPSNGGIGCHLMTACFCFSRTWLLTYTVLIQNVFRGRSTLVRKSSRIHWKLSRDTFRTLSESTENSIWTHSQCNNYP